MGKKRVSEAWWVWGAGFKVGVAPRVTGFVARVCDASLGFSPFSGVLVLGLCRMLEANRYVLPSPAVPSGLVLEMFRYQNQVFCGTGVMRRVSRSRFHAWCEASLLACLDSETGGLPVSERSGGKAFLVLRSFASVYEHLAKVLGVSVVTQDRLDGLLKSVDAPSEVLGAFRVMSGFQARANRYVGVRVTPRVLSAWFATIQALCFLSQRGERFYP
jgi:hypothetical protein